MSLTNQDIQTAYQAILGREASEEEVSHMAEQHSDMGTLRTAFLNSAEFERKYTRFKEQQEQAHPPALVQLHIPKTAGTTLAEALSKSDTLHPSVIIHDHSLDELRDMPRGQRRALRFIRGHLSMGAGEALGFPHRYICLIRQPGPRIFTFYQFVRRTRTHPSFQDLQSKNMNFGDYLEYSVNNIAHRLELDNGQVRRLAGAFDHSSLGQENTLLKTALLTALDPKKMLFGFVENIDVFINLLVAEGYLETAKIEDFNVSPNPDLYQSSVEALTVSQREIFDSYTAWDSYFYDVCQQLFQQNQ